MSRELVEFDGAVDCMADTGAVSLRLHGTARAPYGVGATGVAVPTGAESVAAELQFSDAGEPLPLVPTTLHQVRVVELAPWSTSTPASASVQRLFRIESEEGRFELHARGAQLHRDAAAAFFDMLPAVRVPYLVRLGWVLVLALLRLPGAGRLLSRWRNEGQ